ncbi:MAG: hypothetical protein K0Q49_520 [Haloplasmataceae bacterium]|jgi:hypothetical protein|nr:hypothetical protein [Haloplasmataceae bacterium]
MACPKKKISYSNTRKKYSFNNYLSFNLNNELKTRHFSSFHDNRISHFKKNKKAEKYSILLF